MSQTKTSVNLSAADFTFSFNYKGPSVLIAGSDQNYFQGTSGWAGASPQRGINIPQMMYCENTVPTAEGYRSVAFKFFVEPPVPKERFIRVISLFEGTGASALLGITADLKIFGLTAETGGEWKRTTFGTIPEYPDPIPPWTTPAQITYATADVFSLICIEGVGVFAYDYLANVLRHIKITGIDPKKINGIVASSGYLVAWDDVRVYWSSTENITDFEPSLITGAGSAMVEGLKGSIQLCKEIGGGFIIYTDVTIISAAYSANQQLPWVFDVLAGGAGIRKDLHVAADINTQVHFAWTTGGLVGVELHQVKPMFPALTDFIASGNEDESTVDGHPVLRWLDEYKEVRIAVISQRYMCVSFGQEFTAQANEYPTLKLTQSMLYDMQLQRWGKLNIDHVQIIEAPFVAQQQVFF